MTQDFVTAGRIGIQLNARVSGAIFNPALPEGLSFDAGPPFNLQFRLRPNENDADGFGRSGLDYRVRAELPASADAIGFVRALNARRYEPYGNHLTPLPLVLNDEVMIAADGAIKDGFFPRCEMCPSEVQHLIGQAEALLESARDRFLSLLRWRQGAVASDKLVEYSSIYWRADPGLYYAVPRKLAGAQEARTMGKGFRWGEEYEKAMSALWVRQVEEPLAHELIREAQTLVGQSERSALLLAASAAETGIKQHISKFAPAAAWLLEEAPSPPLFKILRDYIPALNRREGRDVSFWERLKPTFKVLHSMVEARNKLAHTGKIPDGFDVSAAIVTIRDMLYVLDVIEGEDWAKLLVEPSLAHILNWPPRDQLDGVYLVRMSNPIDEEIRKILPIS
jgi:hypothetical protein